MIAPLSGSLTPLARATSARAPAGGPLIWLKADAGVWKDAGKTLASGNGDEVQVWADQSGNGNDATAVNAQSRPTLVTGSLNGLPGLNFMPATFSNRLDVAVAVTSNALTVFTAAKKASAGGAKNASSRVVSLYLSSDPAADPGDFNTAHGWACQLMSVNAFGGASAPAFATLRLNVAQSGRTYAYATPYVLMSQINGSTAGVSLNNDTFTSGATSATTLNSDRLYLGGSAAQSDSELNGFIYEVLVYGRVLNADEVNKSARYLGNRWGVSVA